MQQSLQIPKQVVFVPVVPVDCITTRHTLSRLPVAMQGEPECICGVARRIGYTGSGAGDLAIYRVKIKTDKQKGFVTIPKLFIVKDGVFQDYDQWKRECGQGAKND
ncbi:MAG TPA: hypothetical protein VKV37_11075 [Ktedonobacteraceae bacterium]|jgi:hypothetical protein|nr:hypothetical protein [Ktedonobacteraceae bacterium]